MKEITGYLGNEHLTLYQMVEHSPEWHEFRKNGLGGSDAAAVFGASKYQSKLGLFLEKIGYYKEIKKNMAPLVWGHMLEDIILDMWRYHDGSKDGYLERIESKQPLRRFEIVEGYIVNDKFPWLFHSADAIIPPGQVCPYTGEVLQEYRILEAKTIDPNHARQWERGWPEYYKFQIQQYMLGFEWDSAEIIVGSLDRRLYGEPLYADEDLQIELLEKSHDLWERILAGRELMAKGYDEDKLIQELQHITPDPTEDNPESLNDFLSRNAKLKEQDIIAPHNITKSAQNYVMINKMVKRLNELKTLYELDLRTYSSDNRAYKLKLMDELGNDSGYVTFSTRANSDKLSVNNRAKIDGGYDFSIEAIDELVEKIRG